MNGPHAANRAFDGRSFVEDTASLCRAGRFVEAAEMLTKARQTSEEPWVLGALALLCREQGAYAQALAWADVAIRRGADLAIGHAEAGMALTSLNRRDDGVAALARGCHVTLPHRAEVTLRLAEELYDGGDPVRTARLVAREVWHGEDRDDAAALASACSAIGHAAPGGVEAVQPRDYGCATATRALDALRIGRLDHADRLARRILRVASDDADGLAAVAMLRMRQGRLAEADRLFGEALFRGPRQRIDVLQAHAALLSRLGQPGRAVAMLAGVAVGAMSPNAAAMLADALRRIGRRDDAGMLAAHTLARAPSTTSARVTLWRLATASEERAAGLVEAEALLAELPNDAALLFFLADALRDREPARAAALAARALERDGSLVDAADWAAPPSDSIASAASSDALSLPGLFAPKPDAGSAWPTASQIALLRIAFDHSVDAGPAWGRWCADNDIRDLDAGSYRLMPSVLRRLLAEGATTFVNRALLVGIWRKAQVDNAERLRRALPAIDALIAAGIDVMPLKGLMLAWSVYPDAGSRPMSDIDLLVRPAEALRAFDILVGSGLRPRGTLTPALLHFHYATTLREPSGGHVDLHWRPLQEAVSASYDDTVVWADAVPFEMLGRPLSRPSWTFQLFHVLVHGARWNPIAPVRWVADALLILSAHGTTVDWAALDGLAVRFACRLPVTRALAFLTSNFPVARTMIPQDAVSTPIDCGDEALLLPLRDRPDRSVCRPDEIAALCRHHAPLVASLDGAFLAVIGGTPAEQVCAACVAGGTAWFRSEAYQDVEAMLAKRGARVAFCIDAASNGNYVVVERIERYRG